MVYGIPAEEAKVWQLQAKLFKQRTERVEDQMRSSFLKLQRVPPLHDLQCITYTSYIQRLSLQKWNRLPALCLLKMITALKIELELAKTGRE